MSLQEKTENKLSRIDYLERKQFMIVDKFSLDRNHKNSMKERKKVLVEKPNAKLLPTVLDEREVRNLSQEIEVLLEELLYLLNVEDE